MHTIIFGRCTLHTASIPHDISIHFVPDACKVYNAHTMNTIYTLYARYAVYAMYAMRALLQLCKVCHQWGRHKICKQRTTARLRKFPLRFVVNRKENLSGNLKGIPPWSIFV